MSHVSASDSGGHDRDERTELVQCKARVRGVVQGVFYRSSVQERARALQLAGWVRNCADGSVELLALGPRDGVHRLLEWCNEGPPQARVERVDVEWQQAAKAADERERLLGKPFGVRR